MQAVQQKEIGEIKRFTGLCPFVITMVNPNLEALNAAGVKLKEEPKYSGQNSEGNANYRLDFWLENPGVDFTNEKGETENTGKLTRKYSIWLENRDEVSSKGNVRIVNDILQHSWSSSVEAISENPKMDWFKTDKNARVAKVGEVALLEFFSKLLGLSRGSQDGSIPADHVKFNTSFDDIFNGKLTELREYIKSAQKVGNGLTYLLGVKTTDDGKMYDDVYGRYFQSSRNKKTDGFTKSLNEEYGQFKSNYQNSLEFKFFNSSNALVAPDSPATAKVDLF
jgi:hypothetical protein